MTMAMNTALNASILWPAVLVNMEFENETLYVWSGVGNVTFQGNTYTGIGSFGGISVIEEGATVSARGITISLSGVDSTALAEALENLQLGQPVTAYLALYASKGAGSFITDPLISWQGRMDQPEIVVSGDLATIAVKCESRLLDMNVSVDRRYTLEDSQINTPGELAFQFVNGLQERALYWGQAVTATQNI